MEEDAFSHCYKLTEISISGGAYLKASSLRYINDVYNPNAGLKTLSLGDGVTLCSNALGYGATLSNIIIDGNVASIEDYAFNYCENIAV